MDAVLGDLIGVLGVLGVLGCGIWGSPSSFVGVGVDGLLDDEDMYDG
jgi:hypothetical protein